MGTSRSSILGLVLVVCVLVCGYAWAQIEWGDHEAKCHVVSPDDGTTTTCWCAVGDRIWHDTNCNDTKDVGEEYGDAPFRGFYAGTFAESFDATVTESGGVVTLTIQQSGGGDLTMRFSDGESTLDCTSPVCTLVSPTNLTLGSDASPTENFVYVLQSTKALTVSTSDWPATEHIKVAYLLMPSAAFISSNGPYINQNWNDHLAGTDNQGHMSHMAQRIRIEGAAYFSGVDGGGSSDYLTSTAGNVELIASAGVIYQMHKHTFAAFDTSGGDTVLVVNWSGDAYHNITNLYDIVDDSTGTTITNNKWFNLVIWGVANKTGEYAPMMINLPSGFYNTQASAESDNSGFDNFTIPSVFANESSTGFLIARVTIQMQTSGGIWQVASTVDLRGQPVSAATGGVASSQTEFSDNTFKIFDDADVTKVLEFQVAGISTATTQTLTVQDIDGTIALQGVGCDAEEILFYAPSTLTVRCDTNSGTTLSYNESAKTLSSSLAEFNTLTLLGTLACDADNEKLETNAGGIFGCGTNTHLATAITDGLIVEPDLDESSGTPTDNDVLTYNLAATNFTWVAQSTLGHTTDTGPSPDCSGATTYQNGEAGCVDIDPVYENELNNSAGLLAALSDETGTGVSVFGTSPTFTTNANFQSKLTIDPVSADGKTMYIDFKNTVTKKYRINTDASDTYPLSIGLLGVDYLTFDSTVSPAGAVTYGKPFNASFGGIFDDAVSFVEYNITPGTAACSQGDGLMSEMNYRVTTVAANECVTLPASGGAAVFAWIWVTNSDASDTLRIHANALTTTTIGFGAATNIDLPAQTSIIFLDRGAFWDYEFFTKELRATSTWNPGSLADGAGETHQVTVTGAAFGDFVTVGVPYDITDFTVTGSVQAADTVEIRLVNVGASTNDLASGSWEVRVNQ